MCRGFANVKTKIQYLTIVSDKDARCIVEFFCYDVQSKRDCSSMRDSTSMAVARETTDSHNYSFRRALIKKTLL